MKDSQAQSIANKTTENDASTVKHLTADERETIIRLKGTATIPFPATYIVTKHDDGTIILTPQEARS